MLLHWILAHLNQVVFCRITNFQSVNRTEMSRQIAPSWERSFSSPLQRINKEPNNLLFARLCRHRAPPVTWYARSPFSLNEKPKCQWPITVNVATWPVDYSFWYVETNVTVVEANSDGGASKERQKLLVYMVYVCSTLFLDIYWQYFHSSAMIHAARHECHRDRAIDGIGRLWIPFRFGQEQFYSINLQWNQTLYYLC